MGKRLSYFKGSEEIALELEREQGWDAVISRIRKDLDDVFGSKNLSFLMGSGCSSSWSDSREEEVGIPTMGPMAKSFFALTSGECSISAEERKLAAEVLGLDLDAEVYSKNLESLMEVLFGYRFVLANNVNEELKASKELVESLISKVTQFVLEICSQGPFSSGDTTVQDLYESFYRKLIHRDRALPRPWVFTTNYDLFNETAMDRLGIPYINGFQGSVERRFNPAVFRYALAQQLDLSNRKWSSVDSLIYFAKLHGSVSWESRNDGLFPVVETSPQLVTHKNLLIYPTPAKQNASFASPYSDMFRELQTRVARDQSVLITVGYSFSDEHVNNILFQALTIPTFRLVAFVDPNANTTVQKLRELNDPRIWIIGTDSAPRDHDNSQMASQSDDDVTVASAYTADKASAEDAADSDWRGHYFSTIVKEFFVANKSDDANHAIGKVIEQFISQKNEEADEQ